MKVVTLTINPAVDKSTTVDRIKAESKLRCKSPVYEPGGGGINVSRAMKKLGYDSLTTYFAGGAAGQMLKVTFDEKMATSGTYSVLDLGKYQVQATNLADVDDVYK
mgnify:CR=1 FL=1